MLLVAEVVHSASHPQGVLTARAMPTAQLHFLGCDVGLALGLALLWHRAPTHLLVKAHVKRSGSSSGQESFSSKNMCAHNFWLIQ